MSAGIVDQITLEYLMNRDMYKKLMTNKTVIAQKNKEKDFYRNRISHLTEELLANNEVDGLFSDVSFAFENYVKTCVHYFKIIDESDIIQNDYNGAAVQEEEQENEGSNDDLALYDLDEDLDDFDDFDEVLDKDLVQDEDDGDNEVIDFEQATNQKEEIFVEILEDKDENEDVNEDLENDKMKMMMRSAKMMTGTLDKFMMLKPPAPTLTPAKKIADVLPTQKEINLEDPLLMNKGICKKKNMNNKYGK
jgi:hypothetical protein